jgi:hypothetical protein
VVVVVVVVVLVPCILCRHESQGASQCKSPDDGSECNRVLTSGPNPNS